MTGVNFVTDKAGSIAKAQSLKIMNRKSSSVILIVGGTGTQGGNVAKELLTYGHQVRILSRNPDSGTAKAMEQLGAEVMKGDLREPASLAPVMDGVKAIFSAQYSDPADPAIEVYNTRNMVKAAKEQGIEQIIHTSVAGTNIFPRWDKSPVLSRVWESKYQVEELIRHGGFSYWTILHPSWFMENFAEPLAQYMAPELKEGKLFGVLHPHTPIKLNCGEDSAKLARFGFENPEQFHAKDINIAAEELSMVQISGTLSNVLGRTIIYEEVPKEDAVKRGLWEGTAQSHQWMNEIPGFGFDLKETLSYGIPLKSFEQWVRENSGRIPNGVS